jgi:hypothetical protein
VFYPLRVFQSHHKWFLPPTIGIRAPFVRKQKCFERYPNFQSCQKQVLIIPQCISHPNELTGAKIILIEDFGRPHAPPEDSALFDHAHPTRPEVEDECRPRSPYSSRLSRFQPSRKPRLQLRRRIFPKIFPF